MKPRIVSWHKIKSASRVKRAAPSACPPPAFEFEERRRRSMRGAEGRGSPFGSTRLANTTGATRRPHDARLDGPSWSIDRLFSYDNPFSVKSPHRSRRQAVGRSVGRICRRRSHSIGLPCTPHTASHHLSKLQRVERGVCHHRSKATTD